MALALLFTKNVDCLILDEPTNDLDTPTINILEEQLLNFPGALIFVSHDRYFVDKIASKLYIFKGNGVIEESYQSYSEYLEIEKEIKELEKMEKALSSKAKEETTADPKKKQTKLSYKDQRDLDILPNEIEALEAKMDELNACLGNPECYQEKGLTKLSEELTEIEKVYEEKSERYLEVLELAESFEN